MTISISKRLKAFGVWDRIRIMEGETNKEKGGV